MTTTRSWRLGLPSVLAVVVAAIVATTAQAQSAPDWRTLRTKIVSGEVDLAKPDVVVSAVLPQLALPANRSTIGWVRQDMAAAFNRSPMDDRGRNAIVDALSKVIRDGNTDPAVRVNAALLVGELVGSDRKPWTGLAGPLSGLLGDDQLPLGVRIAAAVGLSRVVDTDGAGVAATVGPALVKTAQLDPAAGDGAAVDWLVGRALRMLAALGAAAPAEATGVATAILADERRPIDVRVWAAAALGSSAAPDRQIDIASGLRLIRGLAVTVVSEEKERAERQQRASGMAAGPGGMGMAGFPGSEAGYGDPGMTMAPGFPGAPGGFPGAGGGFPGAPSGYPGEGMTTDPALGMGGAPGMSMADESLAVPFRRAAWRLAKLADAIDGDSGKTGLVVLGGARTPDIRQMAKTLRDAAEAIDATPSTATILTTFTKLGGNQPLPATPADGSAPAADPGTSPAGAEAAPNAAPPADAAPEPAGTGNPFAQ